MKKECPNELHLPINDEFPSLKPTLSQASISHSIPEIADKKSHPLSENEDLIEKCSRQNQNVVNLPKPSQPIEEQSNHLLLKVKQIETCSCNFPTERIMEDHSILGNMHNIKSKIYRRCNSFRKA